MQQSMTYGSNTPAARWAHIEALFAAYPDIPAGDIDDLLHWFDQEASAYDVAMMAKAIPRAVKPIRPAALTSRASA